MTRREGETRDNICMDTTPVEDLQTTILPPPHRHPVSLTSINKMT